MKYDFSGYATRFDTQCSDGRVIRKCAFEENDGERVPLVWNHKHDNPENYLGYAVLEHRDDGMYMYGSFNESEMAKQAKLLVEHGDIDSLSIYANHLQHNGHDVVHGQIREVSLVMTGANPGAWIETLAIEHNDTEGETAIIWNDTEDFELMHEDKELENVNDYEDADEVGESEDISEEELDEYIDDVLGTLDEDQVNAVDSLVQEIFNGEVNEETAEIIDTLNEEQKAAVYAAIERSLGEDALNAAIEHADTYSEYLMHAEEETVMDVFNTLNEEQKNAAYFLIGEALKKKKNKSLSHADEEAINNPDPKTGKTVKEVFDTFTDKQKKALYAIIGLALEDDTEEDDEEDETDDDDNDNSMKHSEGEYYDMKHNVFEQNTANDDYISHADMELIMGDAKNIGSLKDSFLAHADETGVEGLTYGIGNIDYLFPDATLQGGLQTITRRTDWVTKVMNGVKRAPISRIKSIYADLTPDEARAKGYIKGRLKKEQVFGLLKRTTTPTTVYKKQKLDRDDVIDIKDFDIVAELKKEMRDMLDEELARAFMIGDGRSLSDNDKINEQCIRPIWTDSDLFTIKQKVDVAANATIADKADAIVDAAVVAMESYEGSGNPTLYAAQNWVTQMLLLKDKNGRRIYKDVTELAAAMSVKEIVGVPLMKNKVRTDEDGKKFDLVGLIVNLNDYSVGADKGGSVNMFDDFDIDYNQMKYLIETRCSGSLTKPYSAVALEFEQDSSVG